jgi:hypothetical protein
MPSKKTFAVALVGAMTIWITTSVRGQTLD